MSVGMSQRCQQRTLIDVTRSARASSIVDAERFGGLEVDNQIKSGRLFDWQIAGISSIFVCRRAFLETKPMQRVLDMMKGKEFHKAVAALQPIPARLVPFGNSSTAFTRRQSLRGSESIEQAAPRDNNASSTQGSRDPAYGPKEDRLPPEFVGQFADAVDRDGDLVDRILH